MKKSTHTLARALALTLALIGLAGCGESKVPAVTGTAGAAPTAGQSAGPAATSGSSELDPNKKVSKISVGSNPTKEAYVSGEAFSLEGGTIVVTYDDDSTQELPMTAACFDIKAPGTTSSGTKTVTVKCNSKSTRFTIQVADSNFAVTYDPNYDGAPAAELVNIVKGQSAENKTPVREGYAFVAWYVNPDFTQTFDFDTPIKESLNLYGLWKKDGATYVDVTFDYNFYGKKLSQYAYPVESGTSVSKPITDPARTGYTFSKWVDESGSDYDFSKTVTAAATIKAMWTKAVSGAQEYVFEAEDTNLSGKTGPAISGTANEVGMIVVSEGHNASNDRSVGYLYQQGSSLEFYIVCDEAVSDATISVSLSAEMESLALTPNNYGIYLNDEKLQYGTFEITDVPVYDPTAYVAESAPFQYFVLGKNLSLKQGGNLIKLVTENSDSYSGTTMVAHAPLVDALKIETTGVVIWDENHDVPALDNYQH